MPLMQRVGLDAYIVQPEAARPSEQGGFSTRSTWPMPASPGPLLHPSTRPAEQAVAQAAQQRGRNRRLTPRYVQRRTQKDDRNMNR